MNIEERTKELVDCYSSEGMFAVLSMARRLAELETYITKREEYVEFLVKELGDAQAEVELLKIERTVAHMGY